MQFDAPVGVLFFLRNIFPSIYWPLKYQASICKSIFSYILITVIRIQLKTLSAAAFELKNMEHALNCWH